MTQQVLTANRLVDGQVVYLGPDETWTHRLAEAVVAADEDAADRLQAIAQRAVARRAIVDPYLFEVDVQGGAPHPLRTREIIRARGPSVRNDLGYQAAEG